jgi:hypothetical protein
MSFCAKHRLGVVTGCFPEVLFALNFETLNRDERAFKVVSDLLKWTRRWYTGSPFEPAKIIRSSRGANMLQADHLHDCRLACKRTRSMLNARATVFRKPIKELQWEDEECPRECDAVQMTRPPSEAESVLHRVRCN